MVVARRRAGHSRHCCLNPTARRFIRPSIRPSLAPRPLNLQQALDFAAAGSEAAGPAARRDRVRRRRLAFPARKQRLADCSREFPLHLRSTARPSMSGLRKVSVHRCHGRSRCLGSFRRRRRIMAPRRAPFPWRSQFGGSPVGSRRFELKPGAEENVDFPFQDARRRMAGSASCSPQDAFHQDSSRHSGTAGRGSCCPSPFTRTSPIF